MLVPKVLHREELKRNTVHVVLTCLVAECSIVHISIRHIGRHTWRHTAHWH